MLLDVCLGTRTAWKMLLVFGEAPGKAITRKEIQALTKSGNKVVSKFLSVLQKFGLVVGKKMGKAHYYKLNLSSPFVEQILGLIQLEKKELNNPDFFALNILREFVYELTNTNLENLRSVILFGSYAKRTYGKGSDIDVAIVLNEKNPNDELLITEAIGRLDKRFKKEIQPHYYAAREFEELRKKNRLVQDIVKDGISLL
ncbi:nucleotidyltransferase domain-containing protein [Candidatus Woesearchaeota archaeon]|nr:nucleotidyltransferase domain-containing protein [Candidatus Woesearchaeota archaeon]